MNRTIAAIASIGLLATAAIAGDRGRDAVTAADPIAFKLQLQANSTSFELRLTMGPRSNSNTSVRPAQIGLDGGALDRDGPLRFALAREPGRLDCAGDAARRVATGNCTFTPAAGFSRYLTDRGIGAPSFRQSLDLTLVGADKALVDALLAANYPRPTIDQLTALAALDATPVYIADLSRQGFRPDDLDDLIAFVALKIDADYAGAMLRAGIGSIRADDLIAMKSLGVTPEFLAGMKQAGLRELTADHAVQLKAVGVTPDYVREMIAVGYPDLSANKLTELRAVGVTADDVRRAHQIGIANPTPDQLVQLHVLRH